MELVGIDEEVKQQFYKLASISLCPNLVRLHFFPRSFPQAYPLRSQQVGQIVVDLMVQPPVPGQPSYNLYLQETSAIFDSLKRRALLLTNAFNQLVPT